MHKLFIPAAVAASIALAPVAFAAAKSEEGKVKSYDPATMTLVLENGDTFTLPAGFKDPGLKAGEKVKVSFETKDGKHQAETVSIVK